MTKKIIILLFFFLFNEEEILKAQTNYSTQTSENLTKLKAEAIRLGEYRKAEDINIEIAQREADDKKIKTLQTEIDIRVKVEDYAGAAKIKKQLQSLKDYKFKTDELRTQIESAVVASDFDKAAKLKDELIALTASNNQGKEPPIKSVETESKSLNSNVEQKNTPNTLTTLESKNQAPVVSEKSVLPSAKTIVYAPKINYELTSSGDLIVEGIKLCNIKQTKKTSYKSEFVVYDNSGLERLKSKTYPDNKILFLDDNKSFIPAYMESTEQLAKFIANDSIFSSKGYNSNYKCDFIKKNGGSCYDVNARKGENYLNYEFIEGDVFVYGKKYFSVKKTRLGNPLFETMPEFTVYDNQGKAWMYFEGKDGKMMMLDDGKSFIARQCDASSKSVAEFVAKSHIFNENGFRNDYRDQFISINGGYNASKKLMEGAVRNKSDGIRTIESVILQSEMPIGKYSYQHEPNTEKELYRIVDNKNVVVAYIRVLNATSITESMVTIDVEVVDIFGKNINSKSFSILKGYGDYLGTGLKWLVANNYL